MRHAPRRLAVVLTLTALAGAAWVAGPAWGQAQRFGRRRSGESASAWHDVLAFLGWILLAVVVFGLLVWMVLARRRDDAQPDASEAASPASPRRHRRPSHRGARARTPGSLRCSPSITSRAPSARTRTLAGARTTRAGCARSSSSSAIATAGSWSAGPSRVTIWTSTTWGTPSGATRRWARWRGPWSGWPSGRPVRGGPGRGWYRGRRARVRRPHSAGERGAL